MNEHAFHSSQTHAQTAALFTSAGLSCVGKRFVSGLRLAGLVRSKTFALNL